MVDLLLYYFRPIFLFFVQYQALFSEVGSVSGVSYAFSGPSSPFISVYGDDRFDLLVIEQ